MPVPAASAVIGGALAERPSTVAGLPPHISVVYPFIPPALIDDGVESTLAEIAARFPPFPFRLVRVGRFPCVLYLEPEPPDPFLSLTRTIVQRWRQYPPYGGRYATVVPHLTVLTGPEPPGLAASLEDALPVDCRAEHVHLVVQDDAGRWHVKRRVALGGAPRASASA